MKTESKKNITSTSVEDKTSFLNQKLQNLLNCQINNLRLETESAVYEAAYFEIDNLRIIFRKAKITPTKTEQFVTLWKRNPTGVIEPFNTSDAFDGVIINVGNSGKKGIFVFPKSILIEKGIVSTKTKAGKRAMRVYPAWDFASSNQAQKTQLWQMDYFLEVSDKSKIFEQLKLLSDSNPQN